MSSQVILIYIVDCLKAALQR